jgi:hypothetical protein
VHRVAGTAIALLCGEFRESVHVDFIRSSADGYRERRNLVNHGIETLFKRHTPRLQG